MQETAIKKPFRHPHQSFTWLRDSWDIARMIADIDAGKLVPKKETLDREFIEGYAEQVLALRKDRPVNKQGMSIIMSVDAAHAMALPPEALEDAVILMELAPGKGVLVLEGHTTPDHILSDGQHRIAKSYFEGVAEMPAYIVSRAQARRYLEK